MHSCFIDNLHSIPTFLKWGCRNMWCSKIDNRKHITNSTWQHITEANWRVHGGLAMIRTSHCQQHKHNKYSDSLLLHLLHSDKHTQTDRQTETQTRGVVVPYFWWCFIGPSRVPRNSDLSPHLHPAPLLLLDLLLLQYSAGDKETKAIWCNTKRYWHSYLFLYHLVNPALRSRRTRMVINKYMVLFLSPSLGHSLIKVVTIPEF